MRRLLRCAVAEIAMLNPSASCTQHFHVRILQAAAVGSNSLAHASQGGEEAEQHQGHGDIRVPTSVPAMHPVLTADTDC